MLTNEKVRIKKFTTVITTTDYLDVTLYFQKKQIIKFSLNYRARINGKWHEIYRIDNFHGFLHEQRFWISPEPILLEPGSKPLSLLVDECLEKIRDNFTAYKHYFETAKRKRNGKKTI
jgi:hypothetical protein